MVQSLNQDPKLALFQEEASPCLFWGNWVLSYSNFKKKWSCPPPPRVYVLSKLVLHCSPRCEFCATMHEWMMTILRIIMVNIHNGLQFYYSESQKLVNYDEWARWVYIQHMYRMQQTPGPHDPQTIMVSSPSNARRYHKDLFLCTVEAWTLTEGEAESHMNGFIKWDEDD